MNAVNSTSSRATVKRSLDAAERWEIQGGSTPLTAHYVQLNEQYLFEFPRLVQHDTNLREKMARIHRDQASKACAEVARLLAIGYAQNARLESEASRDNWVRDALGIIEANHRALKDCHNTLQLASRAYNY